MNKQITITFSFLILLLLLPLTSADASIVPKVSGGEFAWPSSDEIIEYIRPPQVLPSRYMFIVEDWTDLYSISVDFNNFAKINTNNIFDTIFDDPFTKYCVQAKEQLTCIVQNVMIDAQKEENQVNITIQLKNQSTYSYILTSRFIIDTTNPKVTSIKTGGCEGNTCYVASGEITTVIATLSDNPGTFNRENVYLVVGSGEPVRAYCKDKTCSVKTYAQTCADGSEITIGVHGLSADDAGNVVEQTGLTAKAICDSTPPVIESYTLTSAQRLPTKDPNSNRNSFIGLGDSLDISVIVKEQIKLKEIVFDASELGIIEPVIGSCSIHDLENNLWMCKTKKPIETTNLDNIKDNVHISFVVEDLAGKKSLDNDESNFLIDVIQPIVEKEPDNWVDAKTAKIYEGNSYFLRFTPKEMIVDVTFTKQAGLGNDLSLLEVEPVKGSCHRIDDDIDAGELIMDQYSFDASSATLKLTLDTNKEYENIESRTMLWECSLSVRSIRGQFMDRLNEIVNFTVQIDLRYGDTIGDAVGKKVVAMHEESLKKQEKIETFKKYLEAANSLCAGYGAFTGAMGGVSAASSILTVNPTTNVLGETMGNTAKKTTDNALNTVFLQKVCASVSCDIGSIVGMVSDKKPDLDFKSKDSTLTKALSSQGMSGWDDLLLDPYSSMVSAVITLCPSAILYHMERQISLECYYGSCLAAVAEDGSTTLPDCEVENSMNKCQYNGEMYIGFLGDVADNIMDMVTDFLSDPIALLGATGVATLCKVTDLKIDAEVKDLDPGEELDFDEIEGGPALKAAMYACYGIKGIQGAITIYTKLVEMVEGFKNVLGLSDEVASNCEVSWNRYDQQMLNYKQYLQQQANKVVPPSEYFRDLGNGDYQYWSAVTGYTQTYNKGDTTLNIIPQFDPGTGTFNDPIILVDGIKQSYKEKVENGNVVTITYQDSQTLEYVTKDVQTEALEKYAENSLKKLFGTIDGKVAEDLYTNMEEYGAFVSEAGRANNAVSEANDLRDMLNSYAYYATFDFKTARDGILTDLTDVCGTTCSFTMLDTGVIEINIDDETYSLSEQGNFDDLMHTDLTRKQVRQLYNYQTKLKKIEGIQEKANTYFDDHILNTGIVVPSSSGASSYVNIGDEPIENIIGWEDLQLVLVGNKFMSIDDDYVRFYTLDENGDFKSAGHTPIKENTDLNLFLSPEELAQVPNSYLKQLGKSNLDIVDLKKIPYSDLSVTDLLTIGLSEKEIKELRGTDISIEDLKELGMGDEEIIKEYGDTLSVSALRESGLNNAQILAIRGLDSDKLCDGNKGCLIEIDKLNLCLSNGGTDCDVKKVQEELTKLQEERMEREKENRKEASRQERLIKLESAARLSLEQSWGDEFATARSFSTAYKTFTSLRATLNDGERKTWTGYDDFFEKVVKMDLTNDAIERFCKRKLENPSGEVIPSKKIGRFAYGSGAHIEGVHMEVGKDNIYKINVYIQNTATKDLPVTILFDGEVVLVDESVEDTFSPYTIEAGGRLMYTQGDMLTFNASTKTYEKICIRFEVDNMKDWFEGMTKNDKMFCREVERG